MQLCPACEQPNPETARFCASCGAALVTGSGRETRKTVTVLFADVAGSTALGERLDPESLRRALARYFEIARTSLQRHGGSVEKFIGDAVMAVFGVPVVHEDDALRAVRAAVELRASVAELSRDLEAEYGVSLHIRIGVNTGEVVVGTAERLATGDAVNVAARLEQSAGADEILVGEETYRLARSAITVETVAPLALKGKTDLIPAWRVRDVIEGAAAFERSLGSALVGRRRELDVIRAAYDGAVADRRCHVVTVLGPPGIGKSRLAREVATLLGDDAVILSGRCLPYGEGITFWPLREIFAAAGAEDEFDRALRAGASEEIAWSVRKLLERMARDRPVVLVLDDLHWAEPTLLDLIEHVAEWTRDAQLLLLCLARPDLLSERPTWPGTGSGQAVTIALDPLADSESNDLIDGLLDGSPVDRQVQDRIRAVAGGNPLFVEQLVAALAEGGDVDRVPSTIQALVAARLDTLSEPERDVLERASVIGTEFEWEALGRLDSTGRRPPGAVLSTLVRRDFVAPHETTEDTFRFRHVLIRDAAYDRISKSRRADLHEGVAHWLEGRGEELDEIIGHHFEQAYRCLAALGRAGERGSALATKAAERLAASGLRANDRGDAGAAVNLLERAVALLPAADRFRVSLLPGLGRALREAGQLDRAETVLDEATERADALGERGISADADLALTDLRFMRSSEGVGRTDVLRKLGTVIPIFEERGDDAGLGRALSLAGRLRFWAGETAAAMEDFERAARHSAGAGDRAQEAESLQYFLAGLHRGPTPVDEALTRYEEIRPRTESNGRLHAAFLASGAHLEAMRADFARARMLVTAATRVVEEHGLIALLESHILPAAGYVELLAGDLTEAENLLRRATEGMERSGDLGYLSSTTPMLVDTLIGQDRIDEALVASDRWHVDRLTVPEDADAHIGWRRTRAKVLARRGDFVDAERLGREAVEIAGRSDYLDARAQAVEDLAIVLGLAGRNAEARAADEEAISLYEAKGNVTAARRVRARVGR